jgi:hypothetical protein
VPILCLDTSAINNLVDDPLVDQLAAKVVANYDVCISALNILEIAKTKNPSRQEALRKFAKTLGRDIEPLELPNHLVRQLCRLFQRQKHRMIWTVAPQRRQFWIAMSLENSLGEDERQEAISWASSLETGNILSNTSLRRELDSNVFGASATPRPRTPAQLLRIYMGASRSLKYAIPSQVYKRETGQFLPPNRLDALLAAKPSIWPLYLMAYAFAAYYGAVWEKTLGPRNPAGIIDLLYAVYLPACDVFVTHDTRHGGQYDALRLLNAFNSRRPRTHVFNWKQFREELLSAGN